jgi:hypothetical protein
MRLEVSDIFLWDNLAQNRRLPHENEFDCSVDSGLAARGWCLSDS